MSPMRVVRGLARDLRELTPVRSDASNVLCKGNEISLFNCLFALPGYTCAHMGACMLYVSGGQRSTLCVYIPWSFSTLCFGTESLTESGAHYLARLSG